MDETAEALVAAAPWHEFARQLAEAGPWIALGLLGGGLALSYFEARPQVRQILTAVIAGGGFAGGVGHWMAEQGVAFGFIFLTSMVIGVGGHAIAELAFRLWQHVANSNPGTVLRLIWNWLTDMISFSLRQKGGPR